jgi:hypothetical protein
MMTQSKALPKERYNRQRHARAVRRDLAAITLSTSHPQEQSLFFSLLPSEIRFLIYQYILCQTPDPSSPIDLHSISPLYRPGHTHHTTLSTSLLSTCRLAYHEAHAIPLRSFTHHFRYLGSTSWLYNGRQYLHHMSSHLGLHMYHFHDNLVALHVSNFTKFFLPHLKWKRVTWTICAYLWPPLLAGHNQIDDLAKTLGQVVVPDSCQEVVVEIESREDLKTTWARIREQVEKCRGLSLSRDNGTGLHFDADLSCQYVWSGSGQARWGTSVDSRERESMYYHTVRLCWRSGVARREYVSNDRLDCLRLDGCAEVKLVGPLSLGDGYECEV